MSDLISMEEKLKAETQKQIEELIEELKEEARQNKSEQESKKSINEFKTSCTINKFLP